VRFVFVDRVVALDAGRSIEVVKNVAASEDVFEDHFPGFPVLPGALMIEVFEQASQLLIAATDDARVGRLETIERAAFRRPARPGDRVRARCTAQVLADGGWRVTAEARVDDQRVASAVLTFALEAPDGAWRASAERVRALARELATDPLAAVAGPDGFLA
jgi:3-hydroxyacyl-[acyl-carrier-protein] dehydratase